MARDAHDLGLYLGTQLHSFRIPPNKGPLHAFAFSSEKPAFGLGQAWQS